MADVGKKTGKKTQAGRDVYKTPEGEMVSEKSTTFEYKGKWINIPTIHGGNQYSEDELMQLLDKGLVKPTSVHNELKDALQAAQERSESLKFNKGGTPMKDQMELFEDGGLKDEGGMIDEESGNEVPIGGTKKGVRDDVPAMVSEGEFVFPEDVTRYIGLDKLMQLRQEAKMGLRKMEAMGQMGNGDEATIPDDMPFGMADLVIVAGDSDEELKMQEGGVVQTAAPRTLNIAQTAAPRPLTQPIQQPTRPVVDFKTLMGQAHVEFKQYRNEQGATLLIPFVGGKAVYPIPSGYSLYEPSTEIGEEPSTPETTIASEVTETINRATGKDRDDKGNYTVPPSEFQKAGGWSMDTSGKDGKDLQIWIDEANKFVNGTSTVVTGISAALGLGLPVAAMTAREKKQILKDIDSKIAQARKTDMAGQVAALENIKKGLEEKTTGLGSAIDSITGKIGDLFNLTSTQKEEATNFASKIQSIEDTIAAQAPVSTVEEQMAVAIPSYDEVPSVAPTPTVEEQMAVGVPSYDEVPSITPVPTPDEGFQQDQASITTLADPRLMEAAGVTLPDARDAAKIPTVGTGGYDETPILEGADILGQLETPMIRGTSSPTAAKVEVTPYEGSVQQTAALDVAEQMRKMTEEKQQQRLQVIDPEFTAGLTAKPYSDSMYGEAGRGYTPPTPVGPTGGYDEIPSLTKSDPYGLGVGGEFDTAPKVTELPDARDAAKIPTVKPKAKPSLVAPSKKTKPTVDTTSSKDTNIASTGRSETEIQKEINEELAGGKGTERANELVKERDSARSNEGSSSTKTTTTTTSTGGTKMISKGDGTYRMPTVAEQKEQKKESGGGSSSSSTSDSGGGYSCYVATALNEKGYWTTTKKIKLIKWCMEAKPENKLDTKLWRNGYVTFGKNVIAPRVDSKVIQWLSNGFYYSTVYNKKSLQAIIGKLFYYIPSYTIGIYKALQGNLVDIERT